MVKPVGRNLVPPGPKLLAAEALAREVRAEGRRLLVYITLRGEAPGPDTIVVVYDTAHVERLEVLGQALATAVEAWLRPPAP